MEEELFRKMQEADAELQKNFPSEEIY